MKLFGRHPLQLVLAAAVFFAGVYSIEIAAQLASLHEPWSGALAIFGLSCYAGAAALLWWKPAKPL